MGCIAFGHIKWIAKIVQKLMFFPFILMLLFVVFNDLQTKIKVNNFVYFKSKYWIIIHPVFESEFTADGHYTKSEAIH